MTPEQRVEAAKKALAEKNAKKVTTYKKEEAQAKASAAAIEK